MSCDGVRLGDSETISFGSSDDVAVSWDGVDLEIVPIATNRDVRLRKGLILNFGDSTDTLTGSIRFLTSYMQYDTGGIANHHYFNVAGTNEFRVIDSDASSVPSGAIIRHRDQSLYYVGLFTMPRKDISQTAGTYTVLATDFHKLLRLTGASGTLTVNFPNSLSIPDGSVLWIMRTGAVAVTISATGTLRWFNGSDQTGNRTLARYGWITVWRYLQNAYYIQGSGLS